MIGNFEIIVICRIQWRSTDLTLAFGMNLVPLAVYRYHRTNFLLGKFTKNNHMALMYKVG
jgi:hypothetical protein